MADKTYVPGMDGTSQSKAAADSTTRKSSTASSTPDKPVLGFFYSVSRTSFGEFWPLYLGPNTIGRDASCDVVLSEGTVSGEHATLIIHQEDDGEVYAGVKDNGSTHGVKVNGKSAHFDVVGCKNMDVIKIGKAYELLFILVDAGACGIKQAENFVEAEQKSARQVDQRIFTGPGNGSARTRFSNPVPGSGSDRTRSMDGPEPDNRPGGGTVPR